MNHYSARDRCTLFPPPPPIPNLPVAKALAWRPPSVMNCQTKPSLPNCHTNARMSSSLKPAASLYYNNVEFTMST